VLEGVASPESAQSCRGKCVKTAPEVRYAETAFTAKGRGVSVPSTSRSIPNTTPGNAEERAATKEAQLTPKVDAREASPKRVSQGLPPEVAPPKEIRKTGEVPAFKE